MMSFRSGWFATEQNSLPWNVFRTNTEDDPHSHPYCFFCGYFCHLKTTSPGHTTLPQLHQEPQIHLYIFSALFIFKYFLHLPTKSANTIFYFRVTVHWIFMCNQKPSWHTSDLSLIVLKGKLCFSADWPIKTVKLRVDPSLLTFAVAFHRKAGGQDVNDLALTARSSDLSHREVKLRRHPGRSDGTEQQNASLTETQSYDASSRALGRLEAHEHMTDDIKACCDYNTTERDASSGRWHMYY